MAISLNPNNQINSLVSLAVQNDKNLLNKIYLQRDVINKKISTLSSLRSSISTLRSTIGKFTSYENTINKTKATSSDTSVLSAYSDYGAINGSISVEVLSLASSYKLGSDSFSKDSSTIITNTGSGTKKFSISCGFNNYDISVNLSESDKDYDVLVKIKDAVNNISGINVRSSIIQENDNSYTLLMESKNSGTSNIISFNDTDGLLYHSKIVNSDGSNHRILNQAKDAAIKIGDNLTITRSSNEIKDAIVGVTLNLYKTGNSLITISQDKDYLTSQLKEFVNNYNNVVTTIGKNIYEQKDGNNQLKGIFYSDSRLKSIRNSLRQLLYTSVDGKSLFNFGFKSVSAKDVSKEESYNITLDESSLSKIIDEDPDSIINFFNSDSGLFKKVESYLDSLLNSSGYIDIMNNSLNDSLSFTTRKISSMEKSLNQKTTYYNALYSTYSNKVDNLKSQSISLQSIYSSLGI